MITFETAIELRIAQSGGNRSKRLPTAKAQFYGIAATTPKPCPLSDGSRITVEREMTGGAQVVRLLNRCRPSNISGFIPKLVVDPVKRRAYGGFSHVGEKSAEICTPLIANGDSSPTPQPELWGSRVVASIFHVRPSHIGTGSAKAVSCHDVPDDIGMQAATGSHTALDQFGRTRQCFRAAVTNAYPSPTLVTPRAHKSITFSDNDESAKSAAGQVKRIAHRGL